MYINKIDDLFDNTINKFSEYCESQKVFSKISKDPNFVKYKTDILEIIRDFMKTIKIEEVQKLVNKKEYVDFILGTIKRYCGFYIYLGIAYFYENGRDLYITNIIESASLQKESTFEIPNFYNVENNSKLINFFIDIKNILQLYDLGKSMDKIKILMSNNPLKYESTINLFNELGEDYITDNFLLKTNFHNILKTLIFRQIYLKEEKSEIINFLTQIEKDDGEYKYIEIIKSSEKKLIDFSLIQKFLSLSELKSSLADEFYNYLEEMRDKGQVILQEKNNFINFLFSKGIIIPLTEEFLRYHDNNEKYDTSTLVGDNLKERDSTKIKYIINKMNNVRNYYSPLLDKNPKLKLDTEKLYSKSHEPRQAVLYNEHEELKVVQKLKKSQNAGDGDLLIDLENMRKYAYINYKNMSKDGIKIRTPKTIQAIRSSNLKKKSNETIELRIGHDNIDLAVIGIVWNPSQLPLECFKKEDLIDANKLTKQDNGFIAFNKVMAKTFDTNTRKLYYWMFDVKKDIPKTDKYVDVNKNDSNSNIRTLISLIYDYYIDLVKNKYDKYITSINEITVWNMDNLLRGYAQKYFDFNLNPEIKNKLIEKSLTSKLKEVKIVEDDVDSLMPGKRDKVIELPIVKIDKETKAQMILNKEQKEEINLDEINKIPICLHYVKWRNITKMSKLKTDEFSQAIVDFGKQYVKENKQGDYICKSCNEMLSIKKYIFQGTYNEELDTFLTTDIITNEKLHKIPKYEKYPRTITNINKLIEKIAYSSDLLVYLGLSPTAQLKKKMIIKKVIDIILLHTEYLRKQPKDRIEQFGKKYNIGKDLTNLFFFELKDEIFLTSSTDTDYYKLIKYNNIVAYILFVIITELNPGQILGLKDDKKCNYFFYEKIGKSIFENIYIRRNLKEKIPINKLPLLCYVLFYFSCILTNNKVWLYNDSDADNKAKQILSINTQKTIIHTTIDLMNTIIEAQIDYSQNDSNKDSNKKELTYLYDFIVTGFNQKIHTTFNDVELMKRLEIKVSKVIDYDEQTKKLNFKKKTIDTYKLNELSDNLEIPKSNHCNMRIKQINTIKTKLNKNELNLLSNCSDGRFHKWQFEKNDMKCNNCNQSYNELIKILQKNSSENDNKEFVEKLRLLSLEKLTKKYCLSGELHDLKDGECIKCKKNPNNIKLSIKELNTLDKNIEEKTFENNLHAFNQMKKHLEDEQKIRDNINKTVQNFNKLYEQETNNKLNYYIIDFIEKLTKILGNKIKLGNNAIQLKDSNYIIDHDYLGNPRKEPIIIPINDSKIEIVRKHPYYKIDILYYKDKSNNIYVYYDLITLQYMGYSDNNRDFKKTKTNASLQIDYSIKDIIMLLGLENQFINLYHINSDYQKMEEEDILKQSQDIVNNYLRTRINNLKQILSRTQSIITNINNNGKITNIYNIEEKELINEFTKKIKDFNLGNDKNKIFEDLRIIFNNLGINKVPDNIKLNISKNYLDTSTFLNMNNSDAKLIFYLIHSFNQLLDSNNQVAIKTEIAYLIIKIIKFSFNLYFKHFEDIQIRKFDYILLNDTPFRDETVHEVGYYSELVSDKELEARNEAEKDQKLDNNEINEALDLDDYEVDDDIDGTMEALDNDVNGDF